MAAQHAGLCERVGQAIPTAELILMGLEKSEVRDGMKIDWNVPITMDDGLVLRA
ncbi:MAG: hypothetical protein HYY46_12695, partial [Deltaproteobacteria bacterium]|nr:hypothetical protein [Deltaproteobacteria bacterium]